MIVDPVCKKEVDENAAPGGTARFRGEVYYFCDKSCRGAFQRSPQKFLPEREEKKLNYDPRMFLGDM